MDKKLKDEWRAMTTTEKVWEVTKFLTVISLGVGVWYIA